MPLISEILQDIAERAGVDTGNEEFLGLVQNKTLSEITVPEAVAKHFQSLLSLNAAKNNPELANHFTAKAKAEVLDTIDAEIKKMAESLPASITEQLAAEKSTFKRLELIKNALPGLSSKPGEPADKHAAETIKALQAQLQATQEQADKRVNEVMSQVQREKEQSLLAKEIENSVAAFQWSDSFPSGLRSEILNVAISKALAEKGAELAVRDGQVRLVQKSNPSLDYMENNKLVTASEFVKSVFVANQFNKVAQQAPAKKVEGNGPPKGPSLLEKQRRETELRMGK